MATASPNWSQVLRFPGDQSQSPSREFSKGPGCPLKCFLYKGSFQPTKKKAPLLFQWKFTGLGIRKAGSPCDLLLRQEGHAHAAEDAPSLELRFFDLTRSRFICGFCATHEETKANCGDFAASICLRVFYHSPLLVLKGIYHYCFVFSRGLKQMEGCVDIVQLVWLEEGTLNRPLQYRGWITCEHHPFAVMT